MNALHSLGTKWATCPIHGYLARRTGFESIDGIEYACDGHPSHWDAHTFSEEWR